MRIHAREMKTNEAATALRVAVNDVVKKYELTTGESLRVVNGVLSEWIASLAKYAIREERHGDPDKPGGLE